jgi:hypothetical protein
LLPPLSERKICSILRPLLSLTLKGTWQSEKNEDHLPFFWTCLRKEYENYQKYKLKTD